MVGRHDLSESEAENVLENERPHKKKKKKSKRREEACDDNTEHNDVVTLDDLEGMDEAWIVKVPASFNAAKLTDKVITLESDASNVIEFKRGKILSGQVSK